MSLRIWVVLAGLAPLDAALATGITREDGDHPWIYAPPGRSDAGFVDQRDLFPAEPCFVGSAARMRVGVVPDAFLVQLFAPEEGQSAVVRFAFEDISPSAELEALDPQPGLHHFFLGSEPAKWRRNVRAYGAVLYRGLYPGIDLLLRSEGEEFEYDLLVAPGADVSQVVVRCEGIRSLEIDPEGAVLIETGLGPLRQPLGRCWEETADGTLREVPCSFRWIDEERFGFDAPSRDPSLFLTIDPRLVWSTYLGGIGGGSSVGDIARSVALDQKGNLTVVGTSEGGEGGGGFPMTPGTFQSPSGLFEDVFITRFGSDGTLIYSSLIGGFTQEDRGQDIAVDSLGRATVVGWTSSPNFPTTPNGWDPIKNGVRSGFVLRLSALGEDLDYSTFLEGMQGSEALTVAVAASGSAIVGGVAFSDDFPTTPGAFDTTFGDAGNDGFVTRLDPSGSSLEWSTFLGGFGTDATYALEIDAQENVTATGFSAGDFPTTPGAYQPVYANAGDVFVARLNATGSALLWATYLGGTREDRGQSVALEPDGGVVVGGDTESGDFPITPGAFQTSHMFGVSPWDAFVTRLDPTGSFLVYSTFLGADESEFLGDVVVDASGMVTLVGTTASVNFPLTPGAFDTNPFGKNDAIFVSRLDPIGSRLFYSSIVGGSQFDAGEGMTMSPTRRVTLVGWTQSVDYPTTADAFAPKPPGGNTDAVVTTMDLVLQGVQQLGQSTPSCLGLLDLNATEMPVAGSSTFGLYCSGAPPLANGWLLIGEPLSSVGPISLSTSRKLGMAHGLTSVMRVQSDAAGYVETRLPLSAVTTGTKIVCQYRFHNPTSCPGATTWSSSNRLLITVQ